MGLFNRKTGKRHVSNPTTELLRIFGVGGANSKSGIRVTSEEALKISTVFACTNLITGAMASLRVNLYKRMPDGKGKKKAHDHKIYELLHDLPNPSTTAFDFWVMYIINLLLTGDGIAVVVRDGNGAVTELWNVPSGNVTIHTNEVTGEVYYVIKDDKGSEKIYYTENILHTRGMRFNNTSKSIDPVAKAREAMGLTMALEEYGGKFFSNGANTGGIVQIKGTLSDDAFKRFSDSFKAKYDGIGNSSKVMFLEEGTEFVKLGTDPDKAQSLESRRFQIAEIARYFYNVPLHKILELDRATFNNIEQMNTAFVQDCLNPISVRIEQSIYKSLLTPAERPILYAKFNTNALLRGDMTSRKDFYAVMIRNGVFSPNDVLDLEDMNQYEGGDVHFVNGSSIPVDRLYEAYVKDNQGKGGE